MAIEQKQIIEQTKGLN